MATTNAGTKGVPRADRELQILDAATAEFAAVGYAATSVATIATRVGISKPMIYHYFGSKEWLYTECIERSGSLLTAEIERIARGSSTGIERGIETLDGIFGVLEPQPHVWRLFFDTTGPDSGPVVAAIAGYRRRIDKVAEEGVSEMMRLADNDDALDISAMTALWLDVVDSLVNWWLAHPTETAADMSQRCARLVRTIFWQAS